MVYSIKKETLHFIKSLKKNFKNYFKSNSTHLEIFLKSKKGDLKNIEYLKTLIRFMDELKQKLIKKSLPIKYIALKNCLSIFLNAKRLD